MRRVLVPTDFSEAALFVTRKALSWVDAMGGELLLLHVVPDIYLRWLDDLATAFIDQMRLEAAYDELREEGQRQFSTWLPYPDNARCRTLVVVGDTADAIVEVAQVEMVDLIIMRAPKRRWWRPTLVGSVTDAVVHRASVPVVTWPGHDQMARSSALQGGRRSHERDTLQQGARQERRGAPGQNKYILKSW
jgi:nucleotide-binding universal stress UspA family protein